MKHFVVTYRDTHYPFRSGWACICGHKLQAIVMGPDLYKEFAKHAPSAVHDA